MSAPVYVSAALLLLAASFVTFRIFVRRDYRRSGRLSLPGILLEVLIFFLWGTFTWMDLPSDWPSPHLGLTLELIGWTLVTIGLTAMLIAMANLGFRRSLGREADVLKQSGPYHLTRNPQVVACSVAVIGYALLWPSWHTVGWVVLYAVIVHMMVLTEEEHLRNIHGEKYVRYSERVPRYLRRPRESRAAVASRSGAR